MAYVTCPDCGATILLRYHPAVHLLDHHVRRGRHGSDCERRQRPLLAPVSPADGSSAPTGPTPRSRRSDAN